MCKNRSVSIVVPIYNEKENVAALHQEIKDVCESEGYNYEIIFVDDGSTDGTAELIRTLYPVTHIRLRRNFGQTSAMDAGIKYARCTEAASSRAYIITMDGDGQNDPADIPRLITELECTGKDVISGWRRKRKDSLSKRFVSRVANFFRFLMIKDGIHDSGCSLKVYRQECFENISLYGEMHRFIPALLKIKGFSIGELEVNHRPRRSGETKYSWTRSVKGFLDMLSVLFWHKFAVRPLHLLGGLGMLSICGGIIVSIIGVVLYVLGDPTFEDVLPIFAVFLFITGIQLFVSGFMADMISKNYFGATKDTPYSVQEIVERKDRKNAVYNQGQ